ncbi:MAG: hypothetical protein ABSC23_00740 [Bryobacteraceae bacterium]|jgi:hypothetical protein
MKTLKVALPAAILMAGFMVCTTSSFGKPEYAKKEGKACTYCHVTMGKKDLNDTGKCYSKNDHSLAKCPVPEPKK